MRRGGGDHESDDTSEGLVWGVTVSCEVEFSNGSSVSGLNS